MCLVYVAYGMMLVAGYAAAAARRDAATQEDGEPMNHSAAARVLAGMPLGDTRQLEPAVMVNLLGDLWFAATADTAPREPES